jgi:NTE family protein
VTRALVLGGGGPVGIGWESGLLVGLAEGGVDVADADAVFGTSAGSFVGAQLALGVALAGTMSALTEAAGRVAVSAGTSMGERLQAYTEGVNAAALSELSVEEARGVLGRRALESNVPSEEEFLGFFSVFDGIDWPERFACTAVDTATGEFVVWGAGAGVELRSAVASSCSLPCVYPPVTIGGRRYMDGGMRTTLNADLAAGHDSVLAVSVSALSAPPGASNPGLEVLLGRITAQLAALRSSGSAVEVIEPNSEFLGTGEWRTALMDVTKAAAAYAAGVHQGREEARRIAPLWNH